MTGEQVEKILDRALSDNDFMGRLLDAPKETASELGIALTDDEADTLQSMDAPALKAFADEYKNATDPEKRRAAC